MMVATALGDLGQSGGVLFTDPKLNAMREAAVAGNWRKLFSIAPRGCVGPAGPTMADGSRGACGDDPTLPLGSPQGAAAYYYWNRTNPLRKNLTLQDLRYKITADGRIVSVPLTRLEIRNFFTGFQWARHDWQCTEGQLEKYIYDAINGRLIYPLAQCAQSSASRRRELIKKAAIAAAVVTGAVMFGPALLSKTGAALGGTASGAAGATAAGTTTAAISGAVGTAATTTGIVGLTAKALPLAGNLFNTTRTVKALLDGDLPPPPISFGDKAFSDWAALVGTKIAEREMRQELTAAETALIRQYVEDERRRLAVAEQPHAPVVNTGLNPQLTAAQKVRADSFLSGGNVPALLMLGAPILFLLAKG